MKNKRICAKGTLILKQVIARCARYVKRDRKPTTGFLAELSAPARRALENKGITTVQQLAAFSKKEMLALHGMGPASIPKLMNALNKAGLNFKK